MKFTTLSKNAFVFASLPVFLFPSLANAGSLGKNSATRARVAAPAVSQQCKTIKDRPLSHFLNAQGKTSAPLFFPPVKDYAGWTDSQSSPKIFTLIDYAGLANDYVKRLGTTMMGSVQECELWNPLPNGNKFLITVTLFTTNALGFAQLIADFGPSGPTIFGAKPTDVVNGKLPAVGPSTLVTTFSVAKQSGQLPDLVDVFGNNDKVNPFIYAPITVSFTSATFGTCANGHSARLDVQQEAASDASGQLCASTCWSQQVVSALDLQTNTQCSK